MTAIYAPQRPTTGSLDTWDDCDLPLGATGRKDDAASEISSQRDRPARALAGVLLAVVGPHSEVWTMAVEAFGGFVARMPAPFCIGTVSLEDGRAVYGLLGEPHATRGAKDISRHGGWRAYLEAENGTYTTGVMFVAENVAVGRRGRAMRRLLGGHSLGFALALSSRASPSRVAAIRSPFSSPASLP